MQNVLFADRSEAGRQLARRLEYLRGEDLIVLGLPRGGIPVAFEVARSLDAPLDAIVVRKLGIPNQPEVGMGALGENGVRIINSWIVDEAGVTEQELARVETRERSELERRAKRFRGNRTHLPLNSRTAVVIDDGVATGSTAKAACQVARAQGATRVVLAVPVAPDGWTPDPGDVDEFVCLETPTSFHSIGEWYGDFSQTSDEEVVTCLEYTSQPADSSKTTSPTTSEKSEPRTGEILIPVGEIHLAGVLTIPHESAGIVVFAHGSGSSRFSRRNRFVADLLNEAGFATLLFDLLTAKEEETRSAVFDIRLLANRLVAVTHWLGSQPGTRHLPIGYFGASTGAAASLWAAAEPGMKIGAIVSRGGRPDLAGPRIPAVTAPTLLIVGSKDAVVLDLNTKTLASMQCKSDLVVVTGATHLFEEPGTLRRAAELAREWFILHLRERPNPMIDTSQDRPADPLLDRAREDAEGVEVFTTSSRQEGVLREAAQGSEVFANPDDAVTAQALKEGSPGHESYESLDIGWIAEDEDESRAPR